MAGLKELRTRIDSIKSTQKITSAMKMVAAARLRKSQNLLNDSVLYNQGLLNSVNRVIQELREEEQIKSVQYIYPKMIRNAAKEENYLLLVFSSDRGLCGGFNVNVAKATIARIIDLENQGKTVKVICVGKKARDILKRKFGDRILEVVEGIAAKGARYDEAVQISDKIWTMFDNNEFDVVEVVTSKFFSAITREVKEKQLLPIPLLNQNFIDSPSRHCEVPVEGGMLKPVSSHCEIVNDIMVGEADRLNMVNNAFYDYEPEKLLMLEELLPQLLRMFMFQAIAHSQASEHGARMTSMDNATRNAKDMISSLTLKYNGIRQTAITTELTEIISGAEAL